jgi:tetratricopeptide (TPR) repeat protein
MNARSALVALLLLVPAVGCCPFGLGQVSGVFELPPPPGEEDEVVRKIISTCGSQETELGVNAVRIGEYDEARKHFRTAAQLPDAVPNSHYLYGLSLERDGEYEDARDEYRRAYDGDPGNDEFADAFRRAKRACEVLDGGVEDDG